MYESDPPSALIGARTRMLLGINYPWGNYGWDFGVPPPNWGGGARRLWRSRAEHEFSLFKSLGIGAVRWFLLGDGLNYPPGRHNAALWQRNGWARPYDPPEIGTEFLEDFESLLALCREKRMLLVPTLMSHPFVGPGKREGAVIRGGRGDILRPNLLARFFSRVLEPLLRCSARYADAIYAWDLMNEPEWVTQPRGSVPLSDMRRFLTEGVGRVNDVRAPDRSQLFKSTIGFTFAGSVMNPSSPWHRLGVTFHQFHWYPRERERLPSNTFHADCPVFVGEFATAPSRGVIADLAPRWSSEKCEYAELPRWADLPQSESAPNSYLIRRLRLLESRGYPAAFLWSARPGARITARTCSCENCAPTRLATARERLVGARPDRATEWTRRTQSMIRRFSSLAPIQAPTMRR